MLLKYNEGNNPIMDKKSNQANTVQHPAIVYAILSFILWIIVDWGTAGGFRIRYFQTYGVTLLLFYICYPLSFTFLIFKIKMGNKGLFLSTLFAIFIIEVIFTGNPLVMTFPACLLGIPLAIAIYLPLTYFPLWFVKGELGNHKLLIAFLMFCEITVMFLTTFGNAK
jgi:hypothetical protein